MSREKKKITNYFNDVSSDMLQVLILFLFLFYYFFFNCSYTGNKL